MKKTLKEYIKIALTIAIIVGMFTPYIRDVSPFSFIFSFFWGWDLESLFVLQIPILVVIPLLMLLIFKNLLNDSILKVLKIIFLLIYLGVLIEYGYNFYSELDSSSPEIIEISVSILPSLILVLLSLKYSLTKIDTFEHILLATMSLPIFLYFVFSLYDWTEEINYGFYIINVSFIALYIISVYDIFKSRSVKKHLN